MMNENGVDLCGEGVGVGDDEGDEDELTKRRTFVIVESLLQLKSQKEFINYLTNTMIRSPSHLCIQ